MASANTHSSLRVAVRAGLEAVADGSNSVFSPLSLHAALALAAVFAQGATLDQMLSFLGSPTLDHLKSASAGLMALASHDDSNGDAGPRLSFASGVCIDRSLLLRLPFRDLITNAYGVATKSINVQDQTSQVAKDGNDWVQNETKGVISDLLPDGAVGNSTSLILDGVYLKGIWLENFDSTLTKQCTFHLLDESAVQVPFMSSTKNQFVFSFQDFKVLKLDYRQKQDLRNFYVLIFLPDKYDGLSELMQAIASDSCFINNHIPNRLTGVGNLGIPKFKITHKFEASQALKDLGLVAPFSALTANFTAPLINQQPWNKPYISSIHHEAAVEVELEGTTAEATTAIETPLVRDNTPPPVDFIADHPFAFAILEERSGSVLFFGHVVNPLVD